MAKATVTGSENVPGKLSPLSGRILKLTGEPTVEIRVPSTALTTDKTTTASPNNFNKDAGISTVTARSEFSPMASTVTGLSPKSATLIFFATVVTPSDLMTTSVAFPIRKASTILCSIERNSCTLTAGAVVLVVVVVLLVVEVVVDVLVVVFIVVVLVIEVVVIFDVVVVILVVVVLVVLVVVVVMVVEDVELVVVVVAVVVVVFVVVVVLLVEVVVAVEVVLLVEILVVVVVVVDVDVVLLVEVETVEVVLVVRVVFVVVYRTGSNSQVLPLSHIVSKLAPLGSPSKIMDLANPCEAIPEQSTHRM